MTEEQCSAKYGAISNGIWDEESHWCSLVELPAEIQTQVINTATGGPWIHVYCNSDFKDPLLRALGNVIHSGCLDELKTFDGCFKIRSIRGDPSLQSAHSWAMAMDLNADTNPLGGDSTWSDPFVQCFKDAGFTWGVIFTGKTPSILVSLVFSQSVRLF